MSKSSSALDKQAQESLKKSGEIPKHIAIIMDGNGRWAKKRFLPRLEGHRAGAKSVRNTVEECRKLGIRYLTLYAFSTENWTRPQEEVSGLMKLFIEYLKSEAATLAKNKVRLRAIGERDKLPSEILALLEDVEAQTSKEPELDLILALSYGSRQELVSTTKKIAAKVQKGELSIDEISESLIQSHLYTADIPDPDLLIRTSDEQRISNFLLWQCAYTEFVFTPVLWPDFSKEEFHKCLEEYQKRERRFGGSQG